MILYVKNWCPWCVEAVEWLDVRGYHYRKVDVLADAEAFAHMKQISGQRKTPTLEMDNGKVLADFDVIQLEKFLTEHNIQIS